MFGFIGKAKRGLGLWKIYSALDDAFQKGVKMASVGDKPAHKSKSVVGPAVAAFGLILGVVSAVMLGEKELSTALPEILNLASPIIIGIGAVVGAFGFRRKMGEVSPPE